MEQPRTFRSKITEHAQIAAIGAVVVIFALLFILQGLAKYETGSQALQAAEMGSGSNTNAVAHLSRLGDFGSYVQGPVAAYWTLAATLLVLATLACQTYQVQEQRKQFTEQHESIKRQNFENAFFQLLASHNRIASEVRIKRLQRSQEKVSTPTREFYAPSLQYHDFEGRDCFRSLSDMLTQRYEAEKEKQGSEGDNPPLMRQCYGELFKQYGLGFAHYFDNLTCLLDFVKKSDIKDKQMYADIVAAQLSDDERNVLFCHVLTFKENLYSLVTEFRMVDNIRNGVFSPTKHA